jgi:hypothetical protein
MTRRQLLNNLDSRELTMWTAFFEETNKPETKEQSPAEVEKAIKGVLTSVGKKHA